MNDVIKAKSHLWIFKCNKMLNKLYISLIKTRSYSFDHLTCIPNFYKEILGFRQGNTFFNTFLLKNRLWVYPQFIFDPPPPKKKKQQQKTTTKKPPNKNNKQTNKKQQQQQQQQQNYHNFQVKIVIFTVVKIQD